MQQSQVDVFGNSLFLNPDSLQKTSRLYSLTSQGPLQLKYLNDRRQVQVKHFNNLAEYQRSVQGLKTTSKSVLSQSRGYSGQPSQSYQRSQLGTAPRQRLAQTSYQTT